jgi:hypothetical protein
MKKKIIKEDEEDEEDEIRKKLNFLFIEYQGGKILS